MPFAHFSVLFFLSRSFFSIMDMGCYNKIPYTGITYKRFLEKQKLVSRSCGVCKCKIKMLAHQGFGEGVLLDCRSQLLVSLHSGRVRELSGISFIGH